MERLKFPVPLACVHPNYLSTRMCICKHIALPPATHPCPPPVVVGFTSMSRQVSASSVLAFLNDLFTRLDCLVDEHGL